MLFVLPDLLYAQNPTQGGKAAEDENLFIPNLDLLIQLAQESSPLLEEQSAMIAIRELQEKSIKNEWTRYLLFFSEYRYGSIMLLADGWPITSGDKSNSTWYNVGARFQLTPFDVLDLGKKRKIAKHQVEVEIAKKEELMRMIHDDVIRLWNKLVSYQEIVKINQNHIAGQEGNLSYAEQEYKAGDIPIMEYSRIMEIKTKADQEYQLAKKELRETYYLLESIVGVKLSTLKPNSK
jgi:outer membrane protein TolC